MIVAGELRDSGIRTRGLPGGSSRRSARMRMPTARQTKTRTSGRSCAQELAQRSRSDCARRQGGGGDRKKRAKHGLARIESVDRQSRRLAPPLLYDLTELQRHANRLHGFTAQRTLDVAQTLYERHKLLSYPRTSSRHSFPSCRPVRLTQSFRAIAPTYKAFLAQGTGTRRSGHVRRRCSRLGSSRESFPTAVNAPADLAPDERVIYDLVCRRLLRMAAATTSSP